MPAIEINGTNIEYMEQGHGDPVILVHGTLGDFRSWDLQMDAFAKKYRTITYSRRYHYPNICTGNESDYSAILHADDLSAFLTRLGIKSAHIVGNSYGAYTAMFLAARHPVQVRSLVLGEPPVLPLLGNSAEGKELREDFFTKTWNPTREALKRGEMEEGVKLFVDSVVSEGAFNSFPPEVRNLIMDNACEFRTETLSPEFWTPISCEDIRKITTPALLLTGEKSLKMLKLVIDELKQCLPDSVCSTVPLSTHELAADNPEAFNEIVLNFLAKQ